MGRPLYLQGLNPQWQSLTRWGNLTLVIHKPKAVAMAGWGWYPTNICAQRGSATEDASVSTSGQHINSLCNTLCPAGINKWPPNSRMLGLSWHKAVPREQQTDIVSEMAASLKTNLQSAELMQANVEHLLYTQNTLSQPCHSPKMLVTKREQS